MKNGFPIVAFRKSMFVDELDAIAQAGLRFHPSAVETDL